MRKLLLSAHVIFSVGLLGTDAAVLTLCVAGAGGSDPRTVYPAAHLLGVALLLPLALLSLVTGIAQGLLTPWGLLRYWWVAVKLVLNSAGAVLAVFVLVPSLAATASAAGAGTPPPGTGGLVRDCCAAFTVLVVTVLLSVFKPFGRLRPAPPH